MDSGGGGAREVVSRDFIVMGASAGGVEALQQVVRSFPPDLPAAVLVVLHLPRNGPRALPSILDRAGPLPAVPAEHDTVAKEGVVYVAPADYYLLLLQDRITLAAEDDTAPGRPRDSFRPSVDALFRSAAVAAGPRLVAVVLSGAGQDGSVGLRAAADVGAVTIVQDPEQAPYPSMPTNALRAVPDALVLRTEEIGPHVAELLRSRTGENA